MSTLESAISIAARAHEGQLDKAGAPYILHPLRVMLRLNSFEERVVGVLHDVLEDTDISTELLRASGFSEVILSALHSVTKRSGETYDEFVLRAASNPIGRSVKLADLADNCDLSRIANPTTKDFKRLEKYRHAIETINAIEHPDA
jgi:(p)ppGpp synthase/HD superfamily hydrolase